MENENLEDVNKDETLATTETEVEDVVKEEVEQELADPASSEKTAKEEDTFKEKYFYLAAEMQNLQKRFDREKSDLLKYGSEKILKDMVEVIDNFERTLSFIDKETDEKVKNIAVGVEMITKLFLDTLKKYGLSQVDALGKEFDPNFHEALAQMPAEGKKDMEVIEVHQNGYVLHERLLRPAKVIVAKNA